MYTYIHSPILVFMARTEKTLHHQLTNFHVNADVKSIYSRSLIYQHLQLASIKVYEQNSPITQYVFRCIATNCGK
jgi:hypothetical protein